jgi:diguanylate cyclase (GGDEF)-like protein
MKWKSLLKSGHAFSEEEMQLKLRFVLLNLLLLSTIFFTSVLLGLRVVYGEGITLAVNIAYLVFALVTFLAARRTKRYFDLLITVALSVSFVFAVLVFDQYYNEISGVSWFILLMIVALIFRGRGTALLFFLLSTAGILWVSIVRHGFTIEKTLSGMIPFVSGAIIVIIFDALQSNMRETIEAQKDKYIWLSRHDTLTEMPNRSYFFEHVSRRLARLRDAESAAGFALLFVDVDRFKSINDRYGHPVGDKVLIEVGRRLRKSLHREDIVARYGGDEFAVILTGTDGAEDVQRMLERLMEEMKRPIVIGEHTLRVAVSIGVVRIPDDGLDEAEILKKADLAMYAAKKMGGNSYRCYANLTNTRSYRHTGGRRSDRRDD